MFRQNDCVGLDIYKGRPQRGASLYYEVNQPDWPFAKRSIGLIDLFKIIAEFK